MAGQLLSSLKAASSTTAVSHEAKLGMMVITILFFAFCFLVYHKMDLHQRQLTQASIQPTAESTAASSMDTTEQLAAQVVENDVQDPLMNRHDLSDGSPFENSGVTNAELTDSMLEFSSAALNSNGESVTANLDPAEVAVPGFSFDEPAESIVEPQLGLLVADAEPAFDEQGLDQQGFDEPTATLSPLTADLDFDQSSASNPMPEPGFLLDEQEPVVAMNENVTDTEDTESSQALDFSAQVQQVSPVVESFDREVAVPLPRDPSSDSAERSMVDATSRSSRTNRIDRFETGARSERDESRKYTDERNQHERNQHERANDALVNDSLVNEAVADLTPTFDAPTKSEPVLLAMAEPPLDNGFSGGFSVDNSSDESQLRAAPIDDPADSLPSFDAVEDRRQEIKTAQSGQYAPRDVERRMAQQSTPFGSRGFEAVTQPSGKQQRNSIRTAGGSGADGKFSLAAFNYQNDVEPVPDDGTAFDSIVVRDGDNYSRISKRVYGTTRYFSALAVFNQHRIAEPKHMRPGMIVLTPKKEVLEERYPQLFVDSKPKVVQPAEFMIMDDGAPAYRVGERETLSEISQRYLGRSSRWIEIYRLNQSVVQDPNKLKAGLILALPEDAAEVNVVP